MSNDGYISGEGRIPLSGQSAKQAPVVPIGEEPQVELTPSNVKKYLGAELSLQLFGPVKDSVYEDRREQCMTCDRRFVSEKIADNIGFCRSCGCGVSQKARLSSKLRMPDTACPIGRWGPSVPHHKQLLKRAKAWLLKKLIG